MTIKIHPIKAFSDNYIWTLHNDKLAVVVDPGDPLVVEEYLSQHQLSLLGILITHHHYDHVDGLVALQEQWDCPVYAPRDERIPGRLITVKQGDVVYFDALSLHFNVLFTPGHTVSHICYHDDNKLFCGDTLFSLGCGRMFEGTATQFHKALSLLKTLPDTTHVYCTHEYTDSNWHFANHVLPNNPQLQAFKESLDRKRAQHLPSLPSNMAIEKALNPFLNCDQAELQQTLASKFNQTIDSAHQAFGLLRLWKDQY